MAGQQLQRIEMPVARADGAAVTHSVLGEARGPAERAPDAQAPGTVSADVLTDIHLDQVFASMLAGREHYDLMAFYLTPLLDQGAVVYRQEVFRDLEDDQALGAVRGFADAMRSTRDHLGQAAKVRQVYQEQAWFLHAVQTYCDGVLALAAALQQAPLRSRGLVGLLEHLKTYTETERFTALAREADELQRHLGEIRYSLRLGPNWVTVDTYGGEPDYSESVSRTFEKFRQGDVKDHSLPVVATPFLSHVEEAILDRVVRLFPDSFATLDGFCRRWHDFVDPTLFRFDREIQFYVAYLELLASLHRRGLPTCYPEMSESKEIRAEDTFDIALATSLGRNDARMVTNSFELRGGERVFLVSGPNQGGKTTFARTVGQLHHLGALGAPVPGREARLHLSDRVYTHFEREEHVQDLRGKLEDDLVRMHEILQQATSASVVVLNEVFSSTTLQDAETLSRRVLRMLLDRDVVCVCVTFLDELASMDDRIVSMVATVEPDDPATRTYKVVRRPPDGLAYATAIAEKYQLTYEQLKGRLQR